MSSNLIIMFSIKTLDHVALRVCDLEVSAQWYERVLNLKRLQPKEWGPFPIFMTAENGTGLALFPVRTTSPEPLPEGDWIKGDHYAFQVDNDNFAKAQEHFSQIGLDFEFQDHFYFHSIYFLDPDGHRLELTTQVKDL